MLSPEELAALKEDFRRRFDANDADHADIKNLIKLQNGRVRELELWQSFIKGVTTGVSSAIHFQSLFFGILGGGGVIGIIMLVKSL